MVDKSKRKKQKQLWVDKEFVSWLKRLKAKKELDGEEISNLGELTRQIVNTPAITDVEKQLLKNQNIADIRIKLDTRRLF
jgi:Zn-dependent M32 family carboxypeptidase